MSAERRAGGGPLVSVVIPSFNAGPALRPALRSVLDQTHRRLEVLLVDDGSTDGSVEAAIAGVGDPRLRVLRQPRNMGKSAAMNRAIAEMRGDFLAVQDADDLSAALRIERQLGPFLDDPGVGMTFCGYELILGGRRVAPTFASRGREACARDIAAFRMPGHDATAMFRRSALGEVRFDEELALNEGLDVILQVGERHAAVVVGEVLLAYRVHRGSITARSRDGRASSLVRVLEKAHARRGLPPPQVVPAAGDRERDLATIFIESTLALRDAGRRAAALRTALTCLGMEPTDPHHMKALVYSVAPAPLVRRLRAASA
jgi:glycosyltransferase involved in cell wall biosynthesis